MKNYKQFTTKKEKFEAIRNYLIRVIGDINEQSFQYYVDHDFNKDYKKVIAKLEKKGIDIDQFFKEFRTEIYHDDKMTNYCGIMDAILYKFDNSFTLSGLPMNRDSEGEVGIKYHYGYHNYDLGRKYILQAYDTFEEYYREAAPEFAEMLIKNDSNYEITTDVNKTCQLILMPKNNLDTESNYKRESIMSISPDDDFTIFVFILGEAREKKKLKEEIYDLWTIYRTGKQLEEKIVNFQEIMNDMWLKENVKKYNL